MKLPVVTWKWGSPPASPFGPEYVNRLVSMLDRHLRLPHEVHCVTDDTSGLDPRVVAHPMYEDHAGMRSRSRSCFRRLRIFDRAMADVFGPRLLQVDLDLVVVDDVTPVFDREEPLVLCEQGRQGDRVTYNPSLLLMDAGVLHDLWAEFHAEPEATYSRALKRGWNCTDMAVINSYLEAQRGRVRPARWGAADGVVTYWRDCSKLRGALPPGARAVLFYGASNPADVRVAERSPWVAEHWR